MKNMKPIFASVFLFGIGVTSLWANSSESPLGTWRTIDDVTHKPKANIEIYQAGNQKLYGKITEIYPEDGKPLEKVCTTCKGAFRNQPLIGVVILKDMQASKDKPNHWHGGTILDPQSDKVYKSNITLKNNGETLAVRGYIGLPVLGRTQEWERVTR